MSVYDEILRASDAIKEARRKARRVVICHPDDAEQIRNAAAEHGLDQLMPVVESPFLGQGMAYVFNDPGLVDDVLSDPHVRGTQHAGTGTQYREEWMTR